LTGAIDSYLIRNFLSEAILGVSDAISG